VEGYKRLASSSQPVFLKKVTKTSLLLPKANQIKALA